MAKNPLTVVRSRLALRDAIRNECYSGQAVGLVPTMGALHNGHLSLLEFARTRAPVTVASIFVNPTQFAPGEDFDAYPRDEAADLARLETAGCTIAYLPGVEDMYPRGNVTDVRVPGLSDLLDGVYRPHFFYGVATVVARLFLHVQPDIAVFGEKDYQQLQVIRRMVADLGFPIEIIGAPTVRDPDGLAQSSRNRYLDAGSRVIAGALPAALARCATRIALGTSPREAEAEARAGLLAAGFDRVDYVSAVDPASLLALPEDRALWPAEARLLGAAWLGKTRLIDNLALALN